MLDAGSLAVAVTVGPPEERSPKAGWEVINLGVSVSRSHVCACCWTFTGQGWHRHGLTYCVTCWDARQTGEPCRHKPFRQ